MADDLPSIYSPYDLDYMRDFVQDMRTGTPAGYLDYPARSGQDKLQTVRGLSHEPRRTGYVDRYGRKSPFTYGYDEPDSTPDAVQAGWDMKTLPAYLSPAWPLAMASDIGEGVARGDPAQALLATLGPGRYARVLGPVSALVAASPAQAAMPPEGFFSVLREAVAGSKSKSMPAEQWSKYLTPGSRTVTREGITFPLREDELKYSGLPEYLGSHKPEDKIDVITMLSELDKRPLPEFERYTDHSLSNPAQPDKGKITPSPDETKKYNEALDRILEINKIHGSAFTDAAKQMGYESLDDLALRAPSAYDAQHEMNRIVSARMEPLDKEAAELRKITGEYSTKYGDPHLPPSHYGPSGDYGGLTLPGKMDQYTEELTFWPPYSHESEEPWIPDAGHFDEAEGLLSHSRVTRRKTTDGRPVRLLEEAQSDWHQQARESGYRDYPKNIRPLTDDEVKEMNELYERDRATEHDYRPPPAPFSKSYGELELKKNLWHAVNDGDEYLALTTGEQQAARAGQIYVIPEVSWFKHEDGTYSILNEDAERLTPRQLRHTMGKDAERILNGEGAGGPDNAQGIIRNASMGGKGHRLYYDEKFMDDARKLAKTYGGEVTEIKLPKSKQFSLVNKTNPEHIIYYSNVDEAREYRDKMPDPKQWILKSTMAPESVQPAIRITPEMRDKIKKIGMPLFMASGVLLGLRPDQTAGPDEP